MRTLAALMFVATLATTALAHTESPDGAGRAGRGAESAPRPGAADDAPRGNPHDSPKRGESPGARNGTDRHDNPTEPGWVDEKTRRFLPQIFMNATADPFTQTSSGDLTVNEMFVHAHVDWNVSREDDSAPPEPSSNGSVKTDPVNRTAPPPKTIYDTPSISVSFDLPSTANPGEMLLVTITVDVAGAGDVSNVTLRATIPEGYTILPSWSHDAWNGGNLTFHFDTIQDEASVFFHVVAPAATEASTGAFTARADSPDQSAVALHRLGVLPLTSPEPGYALRTGQVAAGYVATMTNVPAP